MLTQASSHHFLFGTARAPSPPGNPFEENGTEWVSYQRSGATRYRRLTAPCIGGDGPIVGGEAGMGGIAGNGGIAGTGGDAGPAGVAGEGTIHGGAGGTPGGAAGNATGGATQEPPPSGDGCSCRIPSAPSSSSPTGLALVLFSAFASRRGRRRPQIRRATPKVWLERAASARGCSRYRAATVRLQRTKQPRRGGPRVRAPRR